MYLGRKLLFLILVPGATLVLAAAAAALRLPDLPLARWIAGGALCYVIYGLFDWLGDLVFQRVAPVRPPAGRMRVAARHRARRALWIGLAAVAVAGIAGLEWLAGLGTVSVLFGLETRFADLYPYAPAAGKAG